MCKEVGVSAKGSAMDMILRMREQSVSRGQFDWAYQKVFGASGMQKVLHLHTCAIHAVAVRTLGRPQCKIRMSEYIRIS